MEAIRILRGCGASGQPMEAGRVYSVPGEVSEADAAILVRMGKAEAAEKPKPAAARKKRGNRSTANRKPSMAEEGN